MERLLKISRLRAEKDALEALLRPPVLPALPEGGSGSENDVSHLNLEEASLLDTLKASTSRSRNINSRVNTIYASLEPTIDTFADRVHKMAQYRDAANSVASRVLSIASEKPAERDKEGRRKALPQDKDRSPKRDLGNVLRGLSRLDR